MPPRSPQKMKILVLFCLIFLTACERQSKPIAMEKGTVLEDLGDGIYLVDRVRHDYLNETEFNPETKGMASENMFTDKFAAEIANVMKACSDYLEQHGEFASLDRYGKLPSDWWIGDDFYSTSRVLFVDLLNPELQTIEVIHGLQRLLSTLDHEWMVLLAHDNDYDAKGDYVGEDGEYSIWISASQIQIFSERPDDIHHFMESLKAARQQTGEQRRV